MYFFGALVLANVLNKIKFRSHICFGKPVFLYTLLRASQFTLVDKGS